MAVAALVSLEEYLSTSYDPDCDYVEGRLVDRNAGERDHSYLQVTITSLLLQRGLFAFTELRIQVGPGRFRIPDVLGEREMPKSRFLRRPPYIVVEILSPDDRASDMAEKIDDYLAFGVENVWVIDPRRRHLTAHTQSGSLRCAGQVRTTDGQISISLEEIFGRMPPAATDMPPAGTE
ncbi:MAG TPA: Uma2 family endonuclease [Bryobacteraceae bacterium]|nr:Uma2 family endonuclease [Bryobacteraceae bacterium]